MSMFKPMTIDSLINQLTVAKKQFGGDTRVVVSCDSEVNEIGDILQLEEIDPKEWESYCRLIDDNFDENKPMILLLNSL